MKKLLFLTIFSTIFLYSCINNIYNPTIITKSNTGSFDISFKWKYQNNTLYFNGYNNFWTEIFDLEYTITPLNKKMQPVGKSVKKYIGSIDMDEHFKINCYFNEKNIKFFKIDYYYTYPGYNSSGSRLNYYTIYLKL